MSQETITLDLQPRDVTGKAVKHLRKDGLVPAVIHDHGKDSINVMGDYMQVYKTFQKAGKHHPIELTADGKKFTTIIRTATFEPKKNTLTHIVFGAVDRNEQVEAEVPLHARYDEGNESSPAERAGLLVLTHETTVTVEATPANLPNFIEYDAEKLVEVGDHLSVADLVAPRGVTIKTDPEASIASVYEPSAVAAANDAAGGDEVDEGEATEGAEHGSAADDDQTSQAEEDTPGGRKGFQSNEDHKNEA